MIFPAFDRLSLLHIEPSSTPLCALLEAVFSPNPIIMGRVIGLRRKVIGGFDEGQIHLGEKTASRRETGYCTH